MANPTLTALRDSYFYLDNNFDDLKAACNDQQKKELGKSYASARDNFHKAVTLLFDEDDAQIGELTENLKDINAQIDAMKVSLGKIASILRLVDKAVDAGTKLMSLAKAG
jgi:2'-5' RNA ligase